MSWTDLLEAIKVIGGLGAIFGVLVAVVNYNKTVQLEKAKWLVTLHEKFFEKDFYTKIRLLIDYKKEKEEDYNKLILSIKDDVNPNIQEDIVKYLNFFELISTLYKKDQLTIDEINLVFGYYINALHDELEVMKFIKNSGFQNLAELINEIHSLRRS